MYEKFKEQKPYALLDTSKYPPEVAGRFNSFITTQFDDSLSVEMQMRSIIKWAIDNFKEMDQTYNDFTEYVVQGNLNPFITFLNDLIEYMNEFIETFDEKYQETILDKMQEWYNNGELETLINESLDTKYHEMDQQLNTQLAQTEDAMSKRIDNLVIPISPENANVEVTDAHVSVAKNKTFNRLTDRFESVEKQNQQLQNLYISDKYFIVDWEVGGLDSFGDKVPNNKRVRTDNIKVKKGTRVQVKLADTKGIHLILFDENNEFMKRIDYTNEYSFQQDCYVRFLTGYADDRVIESTIYFEKLVEVTPPDKVKPLYETVIAGEYPVNVWEHGVLVTETGELLPANNRVTSDFYKVNRGMSVYLKNTNNLTGIYINKYNNQKELIGYADYKNEQVINYDGYARFGLRRTDNLDINISDIVDNVTIKIDRVVDSSSDDMVVGEQAINNWESGSITADGGEFDRLSRVRTGFIKAPKDTTFHLTDLGELRGLYLVQYDNNKNHVEDQLYSQTRTTNQDGYVRLVTGFTDDRPIESTDFIQGKVFAKTVSGTNVNYIHGDFTTYYKSEPESSVTTADDFNLKTSTIDDVYQEYEALMNLRPDILSKKLLGYGGDENNEPDESLPIYEYTLSELQPKYNPQTKSPTILLMAGIHGDEKSTVWSTIKFVTQLLNHWDEQDNLESLLSNVNLKIIPIMNPGGYNANTRNNLHGVDCNRNFSFRWDDFDMENYDKGESPYSELETQIARDWMIENKDALGFIDFHNVFSRYGISYLDTPNRKLHDIYSSQLRRMSNHWFNQYGDIDEAPRGQVQGFIAIDRAPMSFQEGIVQGIEYSAIIEVARDFNGVEFTSEVIERGVEVLSNYLLGLLDAYSKNFIQ